jgi:hypothetical protein
MGVVVVKGPRGASGNSAVEAGLERGGRIVRACGMRFVLLLCGWLFVAVSVRATRVEDLIRIHVEAVGGEARVAKLTRLRATGTATAAGRQVRFVMLAARPNQVRVETELGARTLVQGYDGEEAPWEYDTGTWPPQYRAMAEGNAKRFVADSEFDDPLIGGAARGYVFDYAGEVEADGRKLIRILVTRKLTDTFSVFLDDQTFFVVMRAEQRTSAGGRTTAIVTHYEDFRPVEGVLLPHRITVALDGVMTQQTRITRIDANPEIEAGVFSRPKVSAPVPKGGK